MKKFLFLVVAAVTVAGLSGCGSGGTVTLEEGAAIAQPDQVPELIKSLQSNQTLANRFAVSQCRKLGPVAVDALPALIELKTRFADDPEFMAKIDEAIASVEGSAPPAETQ